MTEQHKKIGATVLVVAALVLLVLMARKNLVEEEFPADVWTLMDSETGKLYKIPASEIEPNPMTNPDTGRKTLCPVEICFWGEECRKAGGTRVIMNKYLGKEGPTHCPVCGHIMRFHNPLPPDYTPSED